MTRRHEQVTHRRKLSEIRNIMNSMKTLAMMETHKLERLIKTQSSMADTIENIAKDFLCFNSHVLPAFEPTSNIVLLIGAQRGFCGDFNEQLLKQLELMLSDTVHNDITLIALGNKLHPLLSRFTQKIIYIEGADVVEEVYSVVDSLARALSTFKSTASLYVVHHINHHNELITERLLPPFQDVICQDMKQTIEPVLNMPARDFFLDLTEHYLFSVLHQIIYVSLMIENQHRIQHLENATHHLDEKTEELKRKINTLRQEEIIEEIEVILLNASSDSVY